MTKRIFAFTALFLFAITAAAQTTPPHNALTATIKDANGHPYSKAFYAVQLVDSAGRPIPGTTRATYQGQPVSPTSYSGNLDTNGSLSLSVVPNNATGLFPQTTQWQISISAPNSMYLYNDARAWSIQYIATITADTDLSTQLSALAQPVSYIDVNGPSAFLQPVYGVTPTDPKQLATKGYVDAAVGGPSAVQSGTQYRLPIYTTSLFPQVGPSNIFVDPTGNNLNLPSGGTVTIPGCSGKVIAADGTGCVSTGAGSVNTGATYAIAQYPSASAAQLSPSQVFLDALSGQNMTVGTGAGLGSVKSANIGGLSYANLFQSGGGNNGIVNAQTSLGNVVADPSYSNTEQPTISSFTATPMHYKDLRVGTELDYYHNPGTDATGAPVYFNRFHPAGEWGHSINCQYDLPFTGTNGDVRPKCLYIFMNQINPGISIGNNAIGPSAWQASSAIAIDNNVNGAGIAESMTITQTKSGVGDNAPFYSYVAGYGGTVSASDEGTKALASLTQENPLTYAGTVTGGPYANPVILKTTPLTDNGNQGVGRFLIPRGTCSSYPTTCPAAPFVGTVSNIAAGLTTNTSAVTVSGTVPVSTAWGTLAGNVSTPVNTTPPFTTPEVFNVNVTSGTYNTTELICSDSMFHECARATAVGTPSGGVQSVTIPWRHQHASGSRIYQGGMAGYGLEFTAFNQSPNGQTIRYLYDVFGSTDAHTLQVGRFNRSAVHAVDVNTITSPFAVYNFSNLATNLSSSGTTVTGTFVSAGSTLTLPWRFASATMMIANTDSGAIDGLCNNITWTTSVAFTCTNPSLSGTHTNVTNTPTMQLAGNGVTLNTYALYPMAEVIDVRNTATNPPSVDGTLALEPNVLGTLSNGNIMEEPHHISAQFQGYTSTNVAYNPFSLYQGILVTMQGASAQGGNSGATSTAAFDAQNINPLTIYVGDGGNLTPNNILNYGGAYTNGITVGTAPMAGGSLISLVPQTFQNNDPNFTYGVFNLNHKTGGYSMKVTPNTGAVAITNSGATSTFSLDSVGGITIGAVGHTTTIAGTVALPATGITAGTYTSLTVGTDGRATAGSNPTPTALQVSQVAIGALSNYIENSATMTGAGWSIIGGTSTITGGQTDPYGGTNAVQDVDTGTGSYRNTGAALTGGVSYTACGWAKGALGTEHGWINTGNAQTQIFPTTSWALYSVTQVPASSLTTTWQYQSLVGASATVYFYGWTVVPSTQTCVSPGIPTGASPVTTAASVVSTPILTSGIVNINGAQTTVSCSTSGTAVFSQPLEGSSDKKVVIHLAACNGTASYTYPVAFTNTPSVYASNNVAAAIATAVSTSAVTVTGAPSTGALVLEDF